MNDFSEHLYTSVHLLLTSFQVAITESEQLVIKPERNSEGAFIKLPSVRLNFPKLELFQLLETLGLSE
jgi:hypothetical protein